MNQVALPRVVMEVVTEVVTGVVIEVVTEAVTEVVTEAVIEVVTEDEMEVVVVLVVGVIMGPEEAEVETMVGGGMELVVARKSWTGRVLRPWPRTTLPVETRPAESVSPWTGWGTLGTSTTITPATSPQVVHASQE